MNCLFRYFLIFCCINLIICQKIQLSGNIVGSNGDPLVGVNVVIQNTTHGTSTDSDGKFTLIINDFPVTLEFSYLGYQTKTITVNNNTYLNITLNDDLYSSENVIIVGSRFRPRTSITSPLPVDNIELGDLHHAPQTTFDKMMHYTVPSFNSTQQTVSDATAHFDPADLRGLGPSRTLILINGKRKNPSALVYINDTPGKGDVGVDMNSIPIAAIKRVEVLRDGASAQYGSDAIAGVINIILNDDPEHSEIKAFSGITEEGDGFQIGTSLNSGFNLGKSGFLNLSTSFRNQEETNRAASPGKDGLFGPLFGDPDLTNGTHPWIQKHPDLGMIIGLPHTTTGNITFNSGIDFNEMDEFYSFGGLVYRKGISEAMYRAPYWIPDDYFLLHAEGSVYEGFLPTFEADIFDSFFTIGFRSEKSNWKYDISYSFGQNVVDYTIGNTLNLDLQELSPTEFKAGGYEFKNDIINFDISKSLTEQFTLNLGAEFRQENFITNAGEEASYVGSGAQSFPGIQPQNAINAKRLNIGTYIDLGLDITGNLFLGFASRYENYSDFGDSFTYKISSRLKTSDDRFSIRTSLSSGFRAPSLHQIYLSNVQTLLSGGTVSNQGTFNNNNPILRKLGVEKLTDEKSVNFTFGVAAKPVEDLYISVDYFNVDVNDRIVYSSSISSTDTNTVVGKILNDYKITSLKFFLNAVSTSTHGFDLVARYKFSDIQLNAAATLYTHSINGKIKTPLPLANDGIDIFDRKEQSKLLSSRPNSKLILGVTYEMNPFTWNISATRFGEVTWQHASDPNKDQTFSAKFIFDLNVNYRITNELSFSILVNNMFGTYPDELDSKGDIGTNLGGRIKYAWDVNQFGFNGRVILANLNFSL